MKRVLFSMVLLMVACLSFAQIKSVKEAKALVEDVKPDFKTAQELINEALTNDETKNQANTWNVAGIVQKRINEKENEKAYLKQPYDTSKTFNSTYEMFRCFFKCDELEQIPNEKGKIKFKFRKNNAATMLIERPNLINGGIHYFNKNDNQEAFKFFAMYVDVAKSPMFAKQDLMNTDTLLSQIAYYATLAAVKNEDNANVLKYAPMAKNDKEVGKYGMEFLAGAYKSLGDTVNWIATLKEGIQKYPEYTFFFGHLVDYYSNTGKFDEAMIFADDMIAKNPKNSFFLYVKAYLYQSKEDYDNAIEFYKKTIEVDPNYAEAYSNLGLIYCKQGLEYTEKVSTDFNDPKYASEKAKVKQFYESAKPYYEKARELKPDQKDLWMNGLYTIYYKLNLGAEFEAIEKLMK
ncbi:MAG: tetratricopeptide repeat protein [Bacteroides sp.]